MKTTFMNAFNEAERNSMGFLKSEYAFHVVNRKVIDEAGTQYVFGTVTYAEASSLDGPSSLERFVTLSIAPLRLELDLDIGIGEDRKNAYSIYELHSLEQNEEFPKRQHNLYEAMYDAKQLQAVFEVLAQALRSCGGRFFAGDMSLWEDLSRQRFLDAQSQEDAHASREAKKAFSEKQWKKVIKLLEPGESRLDEADVAKLNYARKQKKKNQNTMVEVLGEMILSMPGERI